MSWGGGMGYKAWYYSRGAPGATAVTLPNITSGSTLTAPSLALTLALPTIAAGSVLFAPTVSPAQSISLPTIASSSTITPPSLAYAITLPTKASGSALFAPSTAYVVTMPTVGPESTVTAPSIAYAITLPTIGPGSVLIAPSAAYVVTLPTVGPGATLTPPTLAPVQTLSLPTISSNIGTGSITRVGVGVQAASATGGATITAEYPTSYSAVDKDFAIILLAGRPSGTLQPDVPTGYTQRNTQVGDVLGTNDVRITALYRKLQQGDAAPIFTVPSTEWNGAAAGMSVQMVVYRGIDPTNPFDVADAMAEAVAASSFTPPSVSTITARSFIVSLVVTSDDNEIKLATGSEQGFTAPISGTGYDTTLGGDHAVGLADKEIVSPGAVTMPTWDTAFGPDVWAGITLALRPASIALGPPTLALEVNLTTIPSGSSLFAPTISATQSISLPTIASTVVLSPPTLAAVVSLPITGSTSQLNAPSVAYQLNGSTISSGSTLFVSTLAMVVILPTIPASSVLTSPTVVSDQNVALPTIPSGNVVNAPTIDTGEIALTLATISSGAVLNSPALIQNISLPTISSGAVLTPPAIVTDQAISLTTIPSGAVLTAPTLGTVVSLPVIGSGASLTPPSVALNISLPTIGSGSQIFSPTLALGVNLPTILSGSVLSAPNFNVGDITTQGMILYLGY